MTENAAGNRGIAHLTESPTSKGKAVWRDEETEEAKQSGTGASSDEIGECEEYDSVMEFGAEEEEAENSDDEDTAEEDGDEGDEDYHEGDLGT